MPIPYLLETSVQEPNLTLGKLGNGAEFFEEGAIGWREDGLSIRILHHRRRRHDLLPATHARRFGHHLDTWGSGKEVLGTNF